MRITKLIKHLMARILSPSQRAEVLRKEKYGVRIGYHCEIYWDVSFGSEPYLIDVGDHVRIVNGVSFVTHDGGMWVLRNNGMLNDADRFGRIKVGNNVFIGLGVTIMPNVTIGNNVIIGVGAIVTKDIPSNSIAVGVPARVVETLDEYYEKNKNEVDYTKHMDAEQKRKYLFAKYEL